MKKISVSMLRDCIVEVLDESNKDDLNESIDHDAVKNIVTAASKLLSAVEAFRDSANGSMTSSVVPQLDQLQGALENMVENPGSYVDRNEPQKKITLRVSKDEVVLLRFLR